MTEPKSVTCSLGVGDLQARLTEIAEVGAAALIAQDKDDGRHILRFHSDPETRRRLEEIVAAEAVCCSFLDLDLAERNGELVLTLAASDEGRPVADGLAVAFAGGST
ncbi:MAG: hypothetical protein ACRDPE_13650 [Solirubrobacterales bacterium]